MPTYETAQDRQREAAVARAVATHLGMSATKLAKYDFADFALTRGEHVAGLLEVKVRRVASTTYPTYHVSMAKLLKLVQWQPLEIYLAVQWTDRLGLLQLRPDRLSPVEFLSIGGRQDRGDPMDIEIMANISVSAFETINDKAPQHVTPLGHALQ
jgi:hypothetical protein